jgi:hypothetical protein
MLLVSSAALSICIRHLSRVAMFTISFASSPEDVVEPFL